MNSPAERLFQRQLADATGGDGAVNQTRLSGLVVGAYDEADTDRRRTERAAKLMALELEEANAALEQSVTDLQSQNVRFGVALDNMANGLTLFDSEGRLLVCNNRQRAILMLRESDIRPGCTLEQYLRASPVLSEPLIQERLEHVARRAEMDFQQTLIGRDAWSGSSSGRRRTAGS